jgi:AcrR family transcriptional regulator
MASLLKALKAKQVYSSSDLAALVGGKSKISILIESRKIKAIGRGYYATSDLDPWDAVVLIAGRYFPSSVISGPSALKIHGLLSSTGGEVQADIDRGTNQKNSLIKFRRISKSRQCGIAKIKFHGSEIKVHEPERCLADLMLNGASANLVHSVISNYLVKAKVNIEKIRFYDKKFKINLHEKIEKLRVDANYLSVEARPSKTEEISIKDHIMRIALLRYSKKGEAGLKLKDVADEAGVSLPVLTFHFSTSRELLRSTMQAFETNSVNIGLAELFTKNCSPVDFAKNYARILMDMADSDDISNNIQRWAMAEKNPYVAGLMERLCNPFIAKMTEKILEKIPHISRDEAESRAVMFGSIVDQYGTMKWFYADILTTQASRETMLADYRRTILEDIVQMIFAPPKR